MHRRIQRENKTIWAIFQQLLMFNNNKKAKDNNVENLYRNQSTFEERKTQYLCNESKMHLTSFHGILPPQTWQKDYYRKHKVLALFQTQVYSSKNVNIPNDFEALSISTLGTYDYSLLHL